MCHIKIRGAISNKRCTKPKERFPALTSGLNMKVYTHTHTTTAKTNIHKQAKHSQPSERKNTGNALTSLLPADCFCTGQLVCRGLSGREATVTHFGSLLLHSLFRYKSRLIYNDFKNIPSYSLYQCVAEGRSTAERM